VLLRLEEALRALTTALTRVDGVVGLMLFGSFARGEYGRRSDVDLLVLIDDDEAAESSETGQRILRAVSQHESDWRLPMHLAPLLASARHPEQLGSDLLHDLWRDGVIIYGEAAALAALRPDALAPWMLYRFSVAGAKPGQRVGLSRRLHGTRQRPGIVQPPGIVLARGAVLVPATQQQRVREALEIAGATYDAIPVWRPV
jgi:predicted nucleotidyltransferase